MNRIVAFGCSNTQGQGLADLKPHNKGVSKYAWPAVLAKNLGFDVWNRGHGGASNKFILHRLLNTDFQKTDIVVIQWTAFCRSCFINKDKVLRMLPSDITRKVETHPESKRLHSAYYYEHFDSDYNAWYDSMVQINMAKTHLDSLGLKNIHFTWELGSRIAQQKTKWNKVNLIARQFSNIDLGWDDEHPGIKSQKLMAEFMQKHLEEIL
tara:strand:- start:131 stop:757 length:627 start_codon:yes stop_codon:yes gene_type:complete